MLSMSNYLPILVAAGVHIGIGCLWYSDYALGALWNNFCKYSINKQDLQKKFALQVACSTLIATALMIAINIFAKSQSVDATASGFSRLFSWFLNSTNEGTSMMNAMKVAGFFWLGFAMPILSSGTIWLNQPVCNFLIDASGELVALVGMALTLSYLS